MSARINQTDPAAGPTPEFKALFEGAPGLYLVLKPDFTIVAVTDAYLRATMTQREDILGRGIFDVFPDNPADPAATGVRNLKASLIRVRDTGVADTMAVQKYDIRRPDSEGGSFEERYWSPVNLPVFRPGTSDLAYIIHRVQDVTEFMRLHQRGAEQTRQTEALLARTEQMESEIFLRAQQLQEANRQLRASEERFRALMDSAPDAMVVVDEQGAIALVNTRTESLFGYARQELLGQPIEILIPERFHRSHPAHRRAYIEAPVVRPMGVNMELFARRRDGTEIPVEISLSPVRTADGLQVASAIRDITDRKRVLEQLREARNQAESATRAKSSFLATASHDLRQPLQTLSLLNGALRRMSSDPAAAEVLAQQEAAVSVMSRLLNALLDISKLESGAVQPVIGDWSVGALLDQLHREFASVAASKGLHFEVQDGIAWARSDLSLVGQVLRNLVSNAIKYTPRGEVTLSCRIDGAHVHVEVSDTGVGMARAELAHIYEEFYQIGVPANASREGYGLGLSIVNRIVRLLNLGLDVQSEPGRGTTFDLVLPSGIPASEHPGTRDGRSKAAAPGGTSRHILLVEDDAAVLNATKMLLKAEGYRVTAVASLTDAVERIRALPDIGLLITDYHLAGGQTGQQVLAAARALRGPEFKTIMITGDTSAAVRDLQCDRAVRFLSKPVEAAGLLGLLEEMLG